MKKTFLILIVFIFLLLSAVAEGVNWLFIGEGKNSDDKYYIDISSITRTSNIVRAWVKDVIKQPNEKNQSYVLHYQEFNCEGKKVRFLSTSIYYNDDRLPFLSAKVSDWQFIPSDSVLERQLEFICLTDTKKGGVK